MAMFSDIQAAAAAIQTSLSDLQTKEAAIKTSVETALAALASSLDANNQQQLDAFMALMTAIQGNINQMATDAATLQTEVTNAISSVPMPPSSIPPAQPAS